MTRNIDVALQQDARINVTPRAKVWLEVEGEYAFGLGICRILEAVDETGSIKNAAARIGRSYRHIWSRIKNVEKTLGIALVTTQVGGAGSRRSTLTEPARELATKYRQMRLRVFEFVEEEFSKSMVEIVDRASGDSHVS
jgi:molybdate transport system regulatory protein